MQRPSVLAKGQIKWVQADLCPARLDPGEGEAGVHSMDSEGGGVGSGGFPRVVGGTDAGPPSSRAEGLLFLHGLESNPGSSLQTEEEAGLP